MEATQPSQAFPAVDSTYNFPQLEAAILRFWNEAAIFEKSLEKPAPRGSFVFFEGPPTANNRPHIGHVLTRVVKDLFPRYRTMRGYRVNRKAGWDTHGLPVEIAIEQKLGFEGKEAIEKHGVGEFNRQCFENVRTYERDWAKTSKRIGFWLDYDNAYFTFTNKYVESVWWLLGQLWQKGLLYQGYKVLPYCPHCGTTLSSHEVAQGYKDIKDPSVYIKFRVKKGQTLKDAEGRTIEADGELYLLAWTTTPWTLPSNVALAVHPEHRYKVVASKACPGQRFLLAENLELPVEEPIVGADGKASSWDLRDAEPLLSLSGKELEGLDFEPLFDFAGDTKERGWYVVNADYVTMSDGTGIVHQAPAYGQDDYLVSREYDLPFVVMVNGQGEFVEAAAPYKGMWFKDADPEIIGDLKQRGLLMKSQRFEHSYPHCWRHDTPLFYFAAASWFIKTTEVKEQLIANNREINWIPGHIQDGRFGKWLENVVDWAISRRRYWGTPLPIWRCDECGELEAVSSYQELFERVGKEQPADVYDQEQFNPHRPHIDEFTWSCAKCSSGTKSRVEEVIDCWFDAGSMPFSQHHYPFENKELIDEGREFPADFISEAIDQTRGWFYTLHAISTLIRGVPSYKNCIVLGHVLDEEGRKMSKRLGNVVEPTAILEKLGADTVRWYFLANMSVGQSSRFSERLVKESAKAFLLPMWNAYSFFTIYANIDGWTPAASEAIPFAERSALDRWILTKLNRLEQELIERLDAYAMQDAARALETFIDRLNNWYIRRSRRRFWADEAGNSKESAYQTLYQVLTTVAKLIAPFTPFMGEELYQKLERPFRSDAEESVHLVSYPEPDEAWMDAEVEAAMDAVLRMTRLGHAARNLSQVKVRQPLAKLSLITLDDTLEEQVAPYEEIILDELNIKALEWSHEREEFVSYLVKPNFRKLGPRFGKAMPAVKAAVGAIDPAKLSAALSSEGKVDIEVNGGSHTFTSEELEVSIVQKEGTTTANDEGLLVVLDTRPTPRLKQEGMAREVISRIQGLRRENNLEYTDRIRVVYETEGDLVDAIDYFRSEIKEETLAIEFRRGPTSSAQGVEYSDEVDGFPFKMRMKVA